jgi:pimeloyl-ACP methyl ester carboxylesterase
MNKLHFLAASLLLASTLAEAAESLQGDLRFVMPAQLVDIGGGRHMNLLCEGHGTPTVILEAGAGASLSSWMRFQDRVAVHTRVCSYDRAGYGHSDASPKALTAANVTADLQRLLTAAALAPPYVMVGHSLGGMYVRHFAATYPGQVAGLVLIDPFTEEQSRRYWQIDPDSKDQYDREVARLRDCAVLAKTNFNDEDETRYGCIGSRPDPRFDAEFYAAYAATRARVEYFEANLSETLNMLSLSPFQMFDVERSLGNMPLIVLTRTPQAGAADETKERRVLREARNAILIDLHDDVAAFSMRSENRVIEGAGHAIHVDKPELVEAAIVEVLDLVRVGKPE